MLRIAEHFHDSDLGRQRQGNEDNYFVRAPLFVVADGMGGAQAGEVASELAVRPFEDGLPDSRPPAEALAELIQAANAQIHEQARTDSQRAGMGTTVDGRLRRRRHRRRRARRRLALLPAARRRAACGSPTTTRSSASSWRAAS